VATKKRGRKTREQYEADRRAIVEMARDEYETTDGDVQVDDTAQVSHGSDNGAYVQAWVWVSFAGTQFDKHPED
jgi:hypothetical protein